MGLKRGQITQGIAFGTFTAMALLIGSVFFAILFLIISQGAPVISLQFLFGTPRSLTDQGLSLQIEGTILVSGLSTILAFVIGLMTAVYLVEYAPKESKFVKAINVAIANLAGVPAIVFGLFGYAFFVQYLGLGQTTLSGILAMVLLELPIVIQASKEALLRVPEGFKNAAYAVGATKFQVIRLQVLPYTWSGALTGAILALARGIGETATIIFIGAAARITGLAMVGLLSPFSTLSISLYAEIKTSPITTLPTQYGIAFLLLIITLTLNLLGTVIRGRFQKKMRAYLESA